MKDIILLKKKFRDSVPIGSTDWGTICNYDCSYKLYCTCGHIRSWHKANKRYCGGILGLGSNKGLEEDLCKCTKFIPSFKLEYLEWKYEQSAR